MSVHAYTCPCQHFLFKGIIGVAKGLPEAVKMGSSGARLVVVH